MTLNPELIAILACPVCKGELTFSEPKEKEEGFLCASCQIVFPIRDDIPVMLPEEAVPAKDWETGKRSVR